MSSDNWELFANYESYELIKQAYGERHGRTLGPDSAREIAAYFIHARSYFGAAKLGAQTVRPLLLYYGVLSLARGLTRFLTKDWIGTKFLPRHGLQIGARDESLCGDAPDFSTLKVRTTKGTFLELGESTGFRSLLRKRSAGVDFKICNQPISNNTEFDLGDILSRTPALCKSFQNWKGYCLSMPCSDIPVDDDGVRISVPKNKDLARRIFNGTKFSLEKETQKHLIFGGPKCTDENPGYADEITPWLDIGYLWITAPYPCGVRLSKILTLFALAYIMGMVVRYYPVQWTALARGLIPDAALPTLSAAINLVENEFPLAIADFLREPVTST